MYEGFAEMVGYEGKCAFCSFLMGFREEGGRKEGGWRRKVGMC